MKLFVASLINGLPKNCKIDCREMHWKKTYYLELFIINMSCVWCNYYNMPTCCDNTFILIMPNTHRRNSLTHLISFAQSIDVVVKTFFKTLTTIIILFDKHPLYLLHSAYLVLCTHRENLELMRVCLRHMSCFLC